VSNRLVDRSPDLKKLRDDGYDIQVIDGYLLVKGVPYVNEKKEVKFGTLISKLHLVDDATGDLDDHTAYFVGEYPCDQIGAPLPALKHSSERKELLPGITIDHYFSFKPASGQYADYYEKIKTYDAMLSGYAKAIDPSADARTFPVIIETDDESVFNYIDTASSRAEIVVASKKLELGKVGIVGLGGTGSYVLDQVAKTRVKEIHLFDGDTFFQHNAFRAPGAPSIEELGQKFSKVAYLTAIYSKMRRGIVQHSYKMTADKVAELRDMNFVFLCLDAGLAKKAIVEKLEEFGLPFVDVGMGIYLEAGSLGGILRATTSTKDKRDHFRSSVGFYDVEDDEYDRNIQIADLNMLNAALAVIKWKKLFGFYHDFKHEYLSVFTVETNSLVNAEIHGQN
jgi:hypothetical protein